MASLTREQAQALMELMAHPAWKVLSNLKSQRLMSVHKALETTDNYRFEQGRAYELQFDLKLRDKAEAVLAAARKGPG